MMPENKEVRKLELCHIAPYVPYGLQWTLQELYTFTMIGITPEQIYTKEGSVLIWPKHPDLPQALFPFLRPLDQLTQEITHNGETFIMMDRLFEIEWPNKPKGNSPYYYNDQPAFVNVHHHNSAVNTKLLKFQMLSNPYWVIQELLKYHFDVFGLIDSGLAIPIHNTK